MDIRERIAVSNWANMAKANQVMDAEIAQAKNKRGIVAKYISTLPARSLPDWNGNPFDFDCGSETESLYTSAAIGIGMCMYKRLDSYRLGT